MGRLKVERLEIETDLPADVVIELRGEVKQNCHGSCILNLRLKAGTTQDDLTKAMHRSPVRIWEWEEGKDSVLLFTGIAQDIQINTAGNVFYAMITAVTNSVSLDQEKKYRSFQDMNMTYKEVTQKVAEGLKEVQLVWCLDETRTIENPLLQYEETDWEFLIRLASHFNSGVMVDETQDYARIYIGIHKKTGILELEDVIWECGISGAYYEKSKENRRRYKDDYCYYILKRRENRQIGEQVFLFGKNLFICSKKICFERGELYYYYKMGMEVLHYRKKEYNESIRGLQLAGEIESTRNEQVTMRLEIDEDKSQSLYFYDWKPVTGNLFYCMPEAGTKALLCFEGADEKEAFAINAVRMNGESGSLFHDAQNRIFEAATKKTLKLFPEEISLFGSKEGTMPELAIRDQEGICLNDHRRLSMEAGGNIVFSADRVELGAPMSVIQRAAQSSMEIHQDFNIYSPGGVDHIHVESEIPQIEETVNRRTVSSPPFWQGGYSAIAAVPSCLGMAGDVTPLELAATGSVPKIGGGKAVAAMADAVQGKALGENQFADALKTIEIDTMNGGYPLPKSVKGR